MQNTFDIFIIGGGINGVGIAADAAGRGLSVGLCEQADLASATSSASSKLIHGGLRYLELYEFGLVRKALKEREILLHNAAHLISPLEFVLPYEPHLRPRWLIRLGLFIYDHLITKRSLPSSKQIDLSRDPRGQALLAQFKQGFSYFDCHTNDARLVILNALSAKEHGATIMSRMRCVSAAREKGLWIIELQNVLTQEKKHYTAKVLVNACGPWLAQVAMQTIKAHHSFRIKLIKGSHILLPKLYAGDYAYILQNADKRVVFVMPFEQDYTLIGTTDVPYAGGLNDVKCSDEEMRYLCDTVNQYFKQSISPKDIIHSYAGVRCLQADREVKASEMTRDYKFELTEDDTLLTVVSGKLTTYRRLAEEAVNSLSRAFPNLKPAWTEQNVLPGGEFAGHDFKKFYLGFMERYSWLPARLAYRYAQSYGTRAEVFLAEAKSLEDLGLHFGFGLYESEVKYLLQNEWARTVDDILWRRTKLGLVFDEKGILALTNWLS